MSEPSRDDAPTPGLAAYLGTLLVLALLALVTLAAKSVVEWRVRREYEQALEPAWSEGGIP